ncbi:MAG: hypothetical protein M0P71_01030 [Melioribacteraceae bacterium]|nr:hypothetical protein [Melioribacteraceae bacterium]
MNEFYLVFLIYAIPTIIMACTPVDRWLLTCDQDKIIIIVSLCSGIIGYVGSNIYFLFNGTWKLQSLIVSFQFGLLCIILGLMVFVCSLMMGCAIRLFIISVIEKIKKE